MKSGTFFLTALLCCLAIFSTPDSVLAQYSVSDFLLTAFEEPNLNTYDAQLRFLDPSAYRLPIIDELELRSDNNEMAQEDRRFAVRIRPANPWRVRRNNAFFNATKNELGLQKKQAFKNNLVERYKTVLKYLYVEKLYAIAQNKFNNISKRAEIYAANQESDFFDAKKFVNAKIEQIDALSRLEEVKTSMGRTRHQILSVLETDHFSWQNFDLISVNKIDSLAGNIAAASIPSLELELIAQRVEVAKREVQLEKADFDIGFFQGEYTPFRNKNSKYGVSFGISIPIFKPNKNQIAERTLEKIELENDLWNESYKDSVKRIAEYEYLKSLIVHYQFVQQQIDRLDIEATLINLSRIEDYDPMSILSLQEGILELEEIRLKTKHRVFEQYLLFLDTFDALTRQPMLNYFSGNLDPFFE